MKRKKLAGNKRCMKNVDSSDRCWWWLASLFMAAMLAVIAGACKEEKDQLRADEVLLSLSFKMPEGDCIHSRTISPAIENTLNNIRVLVFEENGASETFAYEAAVVSETPITIRVKKSTANKKYRLVLLANARQWIPFINPGTAKNTVLRSVSFNSTGKWNTNSDADYTPIPMWGETTTTEVITETTSFQSVSLLRALARIDVGVNLDTNGENAAGLSNFKLTSVSVYRSKNKGYVAPVNVLGVSVPTDASNNTTLTYYVTDEKSLIRDIYLSEVAAGTDKNNALCLVIGGKYNGTLCYYRVDIKTTAGAYASVMRNYRYVINITSATVAGYPNEAEALKGDKTIGITGTISANSWNTGIGKDVTVSI